MQTQEKQGDRQTGRTTKLLKKLIEQMEAALAEHGTNYGYFVCPHHAMCHYAGKLMEQITTIKTVRRASSMTQVTFGLYEIRFVLPHHGALQRNVSSIKISVIGSKAPVVLDHTVNASEIGR